MNNRLFDSSRWRYVFLCTLFFLFSFKLFAQPVNDNCTNAIALTIPNAGFDLGTFTSTQTDLSSATLQTGESFAPSITVAGLTKKSVWYKFSLPTTRGVRVSLLQPGSAIQAGNVGFAIYKTNSCIPGNAQISTKLSPIETFGSTYHPCVETGDYLVQVTSNANANGPIYLTAEITDGSPASYDKAVNAYKFGDITSMQQLFKDAEIECQSIFRAMRKTWVICGVMFNREHGFNLILIRLPAATMQLP